MSHEPAPATAPNVAIGLSTYLGAALSLLSAIGALVAGIEGNDTATVTAGASAVLTALATIGGRMAQAVAVVKSAAEVASPWVDVVQAALASTPPSGTVAGTINVDVAPPDLDDGLAHEASDGDPGTGPTDLDHELDSVPDPDVDPDDR